MAPKITSFGTPFSWETESTTKSTSLLICLDTFLGRSLADRSVELRHQSRPLNVLHRQHELLVTVLRAHDRLAVLESGEQADDVFPAFERVIQAHVDDGAHV